MLPEESKFTKGEPLYADDLLQLMREVKRLSRMVAVAPLRLQGSEGGFVLSCERTIYPGLKVGKADSDIAALSSATPGSGTVSVWHKKADGSYEDSGEDVTAYNFGNAAVTASVFIFMSMSEQGDWLVIFEPCPA
jgi:hypothetical protein